MGERLAGGFLGICEMLSVRQGNHTLTSRFEEQVQKYGKRPAVCQGSQTVSYQDLNQAANRLAHAIVARNSNREEPIGLLFDTSISGISAILAVLKSGRAYVQLDPRDPPERLRSLLKDAQSRIVLTNRRYRDQVEEIVGSQYQVIDGDALSEIYPSDNPNIPINPDHLAWIKYTSGSTGRSKGVMQRHGDLLHFFQGFSRAVGLQPKDHTTMIHSYMSLDLFPRC